MEGMVLKLLYAAVLYFAFTGMAYSQCGPLALNPVTGQLNCTGPAASATAPGSPANSIQYNNAGAFGGSASLQWINATTAPAAPVLATVGTPGATTYGYKLEFHLPTGPSAESSEATVIGNAVLDGTNYNTITVPACTNSIQTVDIYITTIGGNVTTSGLIGNVACGATFNHQGEQGDDQTFTDTTDRSQGAYVSKLAVGSIIGVPSPNGQALDFDALGNAIIAADDSNTTGATLSLVSRTGTFGSPNPNILAVSYHGTAQTPTPVVNGNRLFTIDVDAFDGLNWSNTPRIFGATVDGTPVAGQSVPTRVFFNVMSESGATSFLAIRGQGQMEFSDVAFADLPTLNLRDWAMIGCDDCQATSEIDDTCIAGGSVGVFALRLSGGWHCAPFPGRTSYLSALASLGGETASFPALKRAATTIQAKLADDSAFTSFQPLAITGGGSEPSVGTCGTVGTGSTNLAGFITSVTGACVPVVTFTATAPTGWSCSINDSTTPTNVFQQTGSSTTTATFTGVSTATDVLRYSCIAY